MRHFIIDLLSLTWFQWKTKSKAPSKNWIASLIIKTAPQQSIQFILNIFNLTTQDDKCGLNSMKINHTTVIIFYLTSLLITALQQGIHLNNEHFKFSFENWWLLLIYGSKSGSWLSSKPNSVLRLVNYFDIFFI